MVRSLRRTALALILAVLFLPSAQPAYGAEAGVFGTAGPNAPDLVSQGRHILSELWRKIGWDFDAKGRTSGPSARSPYKPAQVSGRAVPVHEKIGCGIDPNGVSLCQPNPIPPSTGTTHNGLRLGCGIGPDGSTCSGG